MGKEDKLIKLEYNVEKDKPYKRFLTIGDIHLGNRYHDSDALKKFLRRVPQDQDMDIIGMGDLIECATRRSLGLNDQVMEVDDQIDKVIEMFQPFADEGRIVGLLRGNHEKRAMKDASIDPMRRICKHLNVRYLGVGAVLYITIKINGKRNSQKYTVYATHGNSSATTAGGKINACMRLRDVVNAELYLMGHVHSLDHHKEEVYDPTRGYLKLMEKHYVLTGGYLKYWGSYGQEKGYPPPGTSGSPKIKLHGDMKRISVVI